MIVDFLIYWKNSLLDGFFLESVLTLTFSEKDPFLPRDSRVFFEDEVKRNFKAVWKEFRKGVLLCKQLWLAV